MPDNNKVGLIVEVRDANSGEVISKVSSNLNQLGEAGARNGQKVATGMRDIGAAGTAGGNAAAAGIKSIGDHSLSSLDNVRLLRDDLGIRLPRAMEKAISQSRLLSGIIGSLGGALIGLGALEIGVRVAGQIYSMYEKFVDVNGQIDAFNKKLGESANEKFFDVASIEDINLNLEKTNEMMATLQSRRTNLMGSGGLLQMTLPAAFGGSGAGLKELIAAYKGIKQEEAGTARQDDDRSRQAEDDHKLRLQQIRDRKELASANGQAASRQAELNAKVAEAQEAKRYIGVQTHLQNQIKNRAIGAVDPDDKRFIHDNPDAGNEQERRDIQSAQVAFSAKGTQVARTQHEETLKMQAEANEAGKRGEAKYTAEMVEQQRVLRQKFAETGGSRIEMELQLEAVSKRFSEARIERLSKERDETSRLVAEAATGGKTGVAKIEDEVGVKNAAIEKEAPEFADPATKAQRQAAVRQQANAEIQKQQESFAERLQQLDAGRSDHYASESDRITASAKKSVDEIEKAWRELYGGLGLLDARRLNSERLKNDEIVKINADAAKQRQEAGQRVEDETRKIEDEARRQGLPKYQQETAAIVDDYNERIARLEELRSRDAANADKYRRQEIAEEQIKNGKLLEQRRALEEQLAGKLKGLIGSHPLEFLKNQGEQQADKFASQALFHFFPNVSTAVAGGSKRGSGDGPFGLPNVFGHGWGGKHPAQVGLGASQAGSGTRNDNPQPSSLAKIETAATSTMVTATTATISVGAATFTGVASNQKASGAPGRQGGYVPIGGGGYFNVGSSRGPLAGDAGLPGGSSGEVGQSSSGFGADVVAASPWSEAGASGGGLAAAPARIEAGIGTAKTLGADAKSLGSSLGVGGSSSDAGANSGDGGIFDEAGASAATDASLADAGSTAGSKAGGGAASAAGGIISGGLGLFAAIEGKGGFGGALQGAMAGAKLGAEIGGPLGAAIGALGGAGLGLLGLGARSQAEKYNTRTVKPRIANDLLAFESGQSDYQAMYDDLTHLVTEAKVQTRQMGSGALSYYNSTIDPEIKAAQARLTREQKSGRSEFGMSAAQFHDGGLIRDFGSMATTDGQGWIHAQRGEMMLNQQAAMSHADAAMLMNAGASRSDMAGYYGGGGTRAAEPSGGVTNLHFHAPDARGMYQLFMDNKHHVRSALNASSEENSGGSDYA